MRVRITFEVENRGGVVPFHHQNHIAESFGELLKDEASDGLDAYRFFCFSGLKGQTRLSKEGLKYSSRKVTIVVSSANSKFIENLTKKVLATDRFQIGQLRIVPELVDEEVAFNFDVSLKYLCLSPIVINEDETEEINPLSNEFSDILYDSTLNRMSDYGINISAIPDIQKFQIIPDASYLERIKASKRVFSRVYSLGDEQVGKEVRGYTFPFKLFAAREIQDFVYTCGLGIHCSSGFGMLDLAGSNSAERTVPFKTRESVLEA